VGNLYKLVFWLTSHLVNNQALLEEIRTETLPAMLGNEQVDETYLLERCLKLESLINEILRLTVTSSLARVILEPTVVGKKTLKPGNKIMVCVLISSS
jgi:cholesterol 7alpha-monooxygenase